MSILKRLYDHLSNNFNTKKWWAYRERAIKGSAFAKLQYQKLCNRNNAFIPLNVKMETMPIFPHGITGVFISQGAKIGKGVVIFHQVTIGSNTIKDSKSFGAPVIGDNVYIGCGAKVIGNIVVGNGARIGANCVCFKDIPENSTVVLGEVRIIKHTNSLDNDYQAWDY